MNDGAGWIIVALSAVAGILVAYASVGSDLTGSVSAIMMMLE